MSVRLYMLTQHMEPRFYKDQKGQWWKQISPCEFRTCGPNGEGSWCCKHTMQGWPLRDEKDKDKEYAVCGRLMENGECGLQNSTLAKPLQCIMSPTPEDLDWYIENGKCTVRWTKVERPDE